MPFYISVKHWIFAIKMATLHDRAMLSACRTDGDPLLINWRRWERNAGENIWEMFRFYNFGAHKNHRKTIPFALCIIYVCCLLEWACAAFQTANDEAAEYGMGYNRENLVLCSIWSRCGMISTRKSNKIEFTILKLSLIIFRNNDTWFQMQLSFKLKTFTSNFRRQVDAVFPRKYLSRLSSACWPNFGS